MLQRAPCSRAHQSPWGDSDCPECSASAGADCGCGCTDGSEAAKSKSKSPSKGFVHKGRALWRLGARTTAMFSDTASYCTWAYAESAELAILSQMELSGPWVSTSALAGHVVVSVAETDTAYTSDLIDVWNLWGVPVRSPITASLSSDLNPVLWPAEQKTLAQNFLQAALNLVHANLDLLPAIAANYYGGLVWSGLSWETTPAAAYLEKVYDLLFNGELQVEITDDDEDFFCQDLAVDSSYTTGEAFGYATMIAICSKAETLGLYLQQARTALSYSPGPLGTLPLEYESLGLESVEGVVEFLPRKNWRYQLQQSEETAVQGLLTCALIEMASTIVHEAIHSAGLKHDSDDPFGSTVQISCIENTFKYFLAMRLRSQLGDACKCWLDGPESVLVDDSDQTTTSRLTGFEGKMESTFLTEDEPCG